MKISRIKLALTVSAAAAALVACGGGSDPVVLVAASDATVSTNATVAAALAGTSFQFPSGVSSFGTSGTTTLAFSGTAAAPGFSVSSGGNTASGSAAFGSCIFVVSNSTFAPGHPLANGQTVTVNPCTVSIKTSGATANGQGIGRSVAMLLGAAASASATVVVAVNAGGQLVLNGANVATISLTPISGGGS